MTTQMLPERHPEVVTLRTAAVLPIASSPILDAAIQVAGNRIIRICAWRRLPLGCRKAADELGNMVLLPGLINAHCHLDYTHMAGQLPPQEKFTDWLKLIVSLKAGWSLEDYARSWRTGADMLLRNGTTTVGDIEAIPQLLPDMWLQTPLRVISFLEMIGFSRLRSPAAVMRETMVHFKRLKPGSFRLGLSPHSPYCTSPELLRLTMKAARRNRLRLATHVAESLEEARMFEEGRGEMYEWLQRSGRDMSDCGKGSPVKHITGCGLLGPGLLAVHANYLSRGDSGSFSSRQVNVVHCPRSHFYFKHRAFPLHSLARAGVNICLGTDSLASVYKSKNEAVELSMFAEMREISRAYPDLSARAILRMATVNGARALGLGDHLGFLGKGALADMIALPMPAKRRDLYEVVLRHEGPVVHSMIDGKWVFPQTQ